MHMKSFKGFFLTFMGRGFICRMYASYVEDDNSFLLAAVEDGRAVGFAACTMNASGLYRFMIKRHFFPMLGCCAAAFFKKPGLVIKRIGRFMKKETKASGEPALRLSSIGVLPAFQSRGIGTALIKEIKSRTDFDRYYISLDTDAVGNEKATGFYENNGFVRRREFSALEGRRMYEYIYKE